MTTSTGNQTDTDAIDKLGLIGVDRRVAILNAHEEFERRSEENDKALQDANFDLRMHLEDKGIDMNDVDLRRLLERVRDLYVNDTENGIGLQYNNERIEDEYDRLTAEYYAKNPVQPAA